MTTRARNFLDDSDDEFESDRILLAECAAKRIKYLQNAAIVHALWIAAPARGPQGPNRKEDSPFSWPDHVRRLTYAEFKQRYRLSPRAFDELLEAIRLQIEAQDQLQAARSRGRAISAEVRLAMTLRYLAGGQILDLRLLYHVSKSECYRSIWRCVDAINQHLKVEFPINEHDKLAVLESEFRTASRGGVWKGCVGAIDGCHFKMHGPGKAVDDPNSYFVSR